MTRSELIEAIRIAEELIARKPIWTPQKDDPERPDIVLPQYVAFTSQAKIIGYGGSAGGGKTDLAIGKSLTQGRRSIIYRKHYADFEGIHSRFAQLVGDKSIKRGSRYEVRPPTGSRSITADVVLFGSLDHEEKDREKYQGRPYDLIVFDEVTQINQKTVEYLMQWNRSADEGIFCQTVMTFNPPTRPEGIWVKRYFAPWLDKNHKLFGKVESGQLLHRVSLPNSDGKTSSYHWFFEPVELTDHPITGKPLERITKSVAITFVKSSLKDNIYLRHTDYETTLMQSSDPSLVRMMLDGDFEEDLKDGRLSVFKPQHYSASIDRYEALQFTPSRPPDCVAIDAAMGGDDEMVIQIGYREWINGKEHYIYMPPISTVGTNVPSDIAQWEWLKSEVPDILDAKLIIVDVVGGAGNQLQAILYREIYAKRGDANHVIAFKGGQNMKRRAIDDWDENTTTTINAMGYANNITCAWQTAAAAQQHTLTCVSPHDERRRQCLARNYSSMETNYQIEAKEQFSARLSCSPDYADAYAMCAYGLHRLFSLLSA